MAATPHTQTIRELARAHFGKMDAKVCAICVQHFVVELGVHYVDSPVRLHHGGVVAAQPSLQLAVHTRYSHPTLSVVGADRQVQQGARAPERLELAVRVEHQRQVAARQAQCLHLRGSKEWSLSQPKDILTVQSTPEIRLISNASQHESFPQPLMLLKHHQVLSARAVPLEQHTPLFVI